MSKLRKIFTNFRIWVYIVFFILMLFAINPNPWNKGATIRSVNINSSAYLAGIKSSNPNDPPMSRERIISINNMPVNNEEDYYSIVQYLQPNMTVTVKTETNKFLFLNKIQYYTLLTKSNNKTAEDIGVSVYTAPTNNIHLGLDLQGGTRVVLKPQEKLSADNLDSLIDNMNERLNLYGLSDVIVRSASDLSGNQFIIVEIAGANKEEVKELLAKQGKFEAKIGNDTVFLGGKDLTYVCRTAQCAGIDPQFGCRAYDQGYMCRFRFSISLSKEAADRQASLTNELDVMYEGSDAYLSKNLDLYLDDALVDTLRISADLKGQAATDIAISGSGAGQTRGEAIVNSQKNMKRLQTILVTGSLPVKLDIIKTDSISPSLGKEFLSNALLIGVLSIIGVTAVVLLRYRRIKIAVPIIVVITSEILLILGVAAFLRQNLDIAGIAGIIVAIGTGVDDQIVITDETLRKEKEYAYLNWKEKIKRAFFIVVAAYMATTASMIPLLFAGAGLLKGFAITTIIGLTNGVFITRPAFAQMIEILLEED